MFVCVLLKETTRGKTVISQGMAEGASVKRLLNGSKYIYQQIYNLKGGEIEWQNRIYVVYDLTT